VIVLGLSGAHGHDPAAAIIVDGEVAAALEEERLSRAKHANGQLPIESARYCLEAAGIGVREVDVVALPSAPVSLADATRFRYARRHLRAPHHAVRALLDGNRTFRRARASVIEATEALGIDWRRTALVPVEHHLAHAASAYHFCGFEGRTAILSLDGGNDYTSALFAVGDAGRITKLAALDGRDSIAHLYGAMTAHLGLEQGDEERVLEMATHGTASRVDLSRLLVRRGDGRLEIARRGRDLESQHAADCAAALQSSFEESCIELIERHLGAIVRETGQLAFAGGGASNAKLCQRLLARSDVQRLFVPPAPGDAGSALGAAAFVAVNRGERLRTMRHAYLGPGFSTAQCIEVLEVRSEKPRWRRLADVADDAAQIIAAGHPLAWFQGRLAFGAHALGARCVLGSPSAPSIVARIDTQIGTHDRWRPVAASVLDRVAPEMTGSKHASPFMTATFDVTDRWRTRIPQVMRHDGSARVHTVAREINPRFHALLEALERRTGSGVVLSVPMARRAEPIVCSPADALHLFYESSLEYLVLEDLLVTKS